MHIKIANAQLNVQNVEITDILTIQEVRLTGATIRFDTEPGGKFAIEEASATLFLTEASLNRVISDSPIDKIKDLDLKTFTGRIAVSGRYLPMGPVAVPFTMSAVPEIEGGRKLQMNMQNVRVVGAVTMPSFLVQIIGNAINERLAKHFDASKLPIPLRMTGVVVEPGRLIVSATLAPRSEEPPALTE
jgi:hypothetical protein